MVTRSNFARGRLSFPATGPMWAMAALAQTLSGSQFGF